MGLSVVSIGIRHVKVWRVEQAPPRSPLKTRQQVDNRSVALPGSPTPKTFSGRNCLLGSLIDSTFSHSVAVSDCKSILCTIHGDICLLDDTFKTQQIEIVAKVDFSIFSVTLDRHNGVVWFAGEGGTVRSALLDDLMKCAPFPDSSEVPSPLDLTLPSAREKGPDVLAVGIVCDRLITVGSDRVIRIGTPEKDSSPGILPRDAKSLPAHGDAVLGVRRLSPKVRPQNPDFLTFSAKGSVLFWMFDGSCTGSITIPLDQPADLEATVSNEIRALIPCLSDKILVTGDKCGLLR